MPGNAAAQRIPRCLLKSVMGMGEGKLVSQVEQRLRWPQRGEAMPTHRYPEA